MKGVKHSRNRLATGLMVEERLAHLGYRREARRAKLELTRGTEVGNKIRKYRG